MTDRNRRAVPSTEIPAVNGPLKLEPSVRLAPAPCPPVAPVNVISFVLLPVNDAPGKNVSTLSARTKMVLVSVSSLNEPPPLMMMLIPKVNEKPVPPVELIETDPETVSVRTMTSSDEPVMETVKPDGMSMEQSPSGTNPSIHVSGSVNKPDFLAVYLIVVTLAAGTRKYQSSKTHLET